MSNVIGFIAVVFLVCAACVLVSYFNYRKAVEIEEIRSAEYKEVIMTVKNAYTKKD